MAVQAPHTPATKTRPSTGVTPLRGLTLVTLPASSVAIDDHVRLALLNADCEDAAIARRLEVELLQLGAATVPALLDVLCQGSLAQKGVATQVLLRLGPVAQAALTRFCVQYKTHPELNWVVAFMAHHLNITLS